MPTLDLGCGGTKRGDVGIDCEPWPGVDHVVRLGFQPIPYPDDTFDGATMIQAIEHIPFVLFDQGGTRTYPMVYFLKEVLRVLKRGARFHIETLEFPDPRAVEDPTHCSLWTRETIWHFVGGRDPVGSENDRMAGLRVGFRAIHSVLRADQILEIELEKP